VIEARPFKTLKAWETWLRKNHAKSDGIWIRFGSKGSGIPSITYAEAVEGALCWGWIDGQRNKDEVEGTWLQKYTPRRKNSLWSKINRDKAEALIAAGRMRPPGLAEIERAKADGRWNKAYYGQKEATVPDDLAAALAANPRAAKFFETLDRVNRYAILFRIGNVKRAETRARKIAEFVAMLARGEKVHGT
jgi:uncharacterized protein YdeI (YjbR/CyaY-like superfamily)